MKPINNLPKHVAIIPDGNRRWAKERTLPTLAGHKRGSAVATEIARTARSLGIHTLTLWGFSTENWSRTVSEKNYLFDLFINQTDSFLQEAKRDKVKIIHLGRKDRLPTKLVNKIIQAEKETKNNHQHILNLALDYGGRDEILRAIKRSQVAKQTGKTITSELFESYLDTANQPYPCPDLIIRTSGEKRISGFLAWQSVYSEYYFEEKHFPDFTPQRFQKAIADYERRHRRFGGN